jgi:xanthine dehydrogenase YagR molybdenum-binding subunit
VTGDPDKGFQEAEVVIEGLYGIPVITHCCLEPHGQVLEWQDKNFTVYTSTQNVSGMAGQYAQPLQIPASDIKVRMDYVGGGFGSKFGADGWGIESAHLAKQAGAPGLDRPSSGTRNCLSRELVFTFAKIKVGARRTERWWRGSPNRGHLEA